MTQLREITLSEDKKEESESPKEATEATKETKSKDGISAREMAAVAEAEAKAASQRLKAAKEAADKKIEDEYEKIKKELKIEKAPDEYTDKRSGDIIFRRELGEPEFWLDRKDRVPPRPVLTDDEEKQHLHQNFLIVLIFVVLLFSFLKLQFHNLMFLQILY